MNSILIIDTELRTENKEAKAYKPSIPGHGKRWNTDTLRAAIEGLQGAGRLDVSSCKDKDLAHRGKPHCCYWMQGRQSDRLLLALEGPMGWILISPLIVHPSCHRPAHNKALEMMMTAYRPSGLFLPSIICPP